MSSLQIKKKKSPLLLTPRKRRGGDGLRRRSRVGSRFNPARHGSPGLPGRMEIGAAATHSNPSPPKSAEPGLTYRACEWERGPGAPRGAAGRRAEPQLRRSRRRGSESPDKARDGEAERRLMASPTRRAPPAPLRPPARLGAAQRRSERSPVRAASAPPPPGPPRPRLAPPPPSGHSASPPSLPPRWGLHENKKRKRKNAFLSFFFFFGGGQGRRVETFGVFCPQLSLTCGAAGRAGGGGARGWSRRARVES